MDNSTRSLLVGIKEEGSASAGTKELLGWLDEALFTVVVNEHVLRSDPFLLHSRGSDINFISAQKKCKVRRKHLFFIFFLLLKKRVEGSSNPYLMLSPPPVPVTHPRP